jgi:peptidoglycan hydrolase-like protein with peptidoglycan-binding domain
MSRGTKITAGQKKKSTGAAVTRVQEYLDRFGYLGTADTEHDVFGAPSFPLGDGDDLATVVGRPSAAKKGTFDDATADAVSRFQEFASLPVTGVVDEATA